jgi:hypothetical protein
MEPLVVKTVVSAATRQGSIQIQGPLGFTFVHWVIPPVRRKDKLWHGTRQGPESIQVKGACGSGARALSQPPMLQHRAGSDDERSTERVCPWGRSWAMEHDQGFVTDLTGVEAGDATTYYLFSLHIPVAIGVFIKRLTQYQQRLTC